MILLLDIGNSVLKWATLDDEGQVSPAARVLISAIDDSECFVRGWCVSQPPARVVAASVAGESVNSVIASAVKNAWGLETEFLRAQAEGWGVTNAYVEPQRLGVDRWAALVAARNRFRRPAFVVDCGTALTIDVLADDGLHLGGLIVPGLSLMRKALEQNTRIKLVGEGENDIRLLARDTLGAVNGGSLYAIVAFIDRVLLDTTSALGAEPVCLLTGGDAQRILPLLATDYDYAPDLVLEGLAVIAGGGA